MRPESQARRSGPNLLSHGRPRGGLVRRHSNGDQRASNIELFFDLVYVFAITQLSGFVLGHEESLSAVGHGVVLLAMVWLVWAFTMWVTNWVDPDRPIPRVTLIAMMAASLVLAAGIPEAFTTRGAWIGISYAAMQIGRSIVAVYALRDDPLGRNFQRILAWCTVSGGFAIAGGELHGNGRLLCWLITIAVDLLGGPLGFPVPGLGRSTSTDWEIEGHHIAERCQAFILIALGESIVRIGETLAEADHPIHSQLVGFAAAFLGAVALWWIYFDRSADAATEVVVRSEDPGALGRSAYHMIHPLMVAGIIGTAAADELVVFTPNLTAGTRVAGLMIGGGGLFLAGHAAFRYAVWRVVAWERIAGIAVLLCLLALANHVDRLTLGLLVGLVVVGVAVSDHFIYPLPNEAKVQTG